MTGPRIEALRADHPDAAALLAAYLAELRARLGGFDEDRSTPAPPDEMAPPSGTFLVLYDDDGPVACGGLKTFEPGVGEIKRMYVAPVARRRGHGRRVLVALEAAARDLGLQRIVLDTASVLGEAIALYLSSGYRQVPAYNANPYAAAWFEKRLA